MNVLINWNNFYKSRKYQYFFLYHVITDFVSIINVIDSKFWDEENKQLK